MKLTKANLKGIWAGVPLSWDERFELDEKSYRKNIARLVRDGVAGIYINGTAGEFYALSWDEFRRIVDVFLDEARGVLTQVGCCATHTREVIRMIEYAAERGASGVQVVIPFWSRLSEREMTGFFADLSQACGDVSIIHYENPNTRWQLNVHHYRQITAVCTNLAGVKYGGALSDIQYLQEEMPKLCIFVGEHELASACMLGACGSYATLPYINGQFAQRYWRAIAEGAWKTALEYQATMVRFFREAEGATDYAGPGIDKLLGIASGYLSGSARMRKPYASPTPEQIDAVRQVIAARFPFMVAKADDRGEP